MTLLEEIGIVKKKGTFLEWAPYPIVPVTRKGITYVVPFFNYPSQAIQSSIAWFAISPRKTDSVRI